MSLPDPAKWLGIPNLTVRGVPAHRSQLKPPMKKDKFGQFDNTGNWDWNLQGDRKTRKSSPSELSPTNSKSSNGSSGFGSDDSPRDSNPCRSEEAFNRWVQTLQEYDTDSESEGERTPVREKNTVPSEDATVVEARPNAANFVVEEESLFRMPSTRRQGHKQNDRLVKRSIAAKDGGTPFSLTVFDMTISVLLSRGYDYDQLFKNGVYYEWCCHQELDRIKYFIANLQPHFYNGSPVQVHSNVPMNPRWDSYEPEVHSSIYRHLDISLCDAATLVTLNLMYDQCLAAGDHVTLPKTPTKTQSTCNDSSPNTSASTLVSSPVSDISEVPNQTTVSPAKSDATVLKFEPVDLKRSRSESTTISKFQMWRVRGGARPRSRRYNAQYMKGLRDCVDVDNLFHGMELADTTEVRALLLSESQVKAMRLRRQKRALDLSKTQRRKCQYRNFESRRRQPQTPMMQTSQPRQLPQSFMAPPVNSMPFQAPDVYMPMMPQAFQFNIPSRDYIAPEYPHHVVCSRDSPSAQQMSEYYFSPDVTPIASSTPRRLR